MRAVWLNGFGGPEVLVAGDAPDPVPGPGQVVVEVAYANLTFVETQFRATGFGPFTADDLPMIPGNGVGGVIAEAGPGVDPSLVGRRVVTGTGGSGGYAQRVAVDAAAPFAVPETLPLDAATALLADGRTATMLMAAAGLRRSGTHGAAEATTGDEDTRVLVEAAAGGVGSLLVQLARAAGVRVVAAAGGPRKLAIARDLGAHVTVDYREADWPGTVRARLDGPATGARGRDSAAVDVVFDGVGGDVGRAAFGLLRPGGLLLSFGLAAGAWTDVPETEAAARNVRLVRPSASPEELRTYTAQALAAGASGLLRPVIGGRFPLERAAAAHALMESRATVGKTLLEIARTNHEAPSPDGASRLPAPADL